MSSSLSPLETLRQEIDRIDDAMHDLLMQRAALAGRIRAAKPAGTTTLRPGREAIVLRRLLARNDGSYPPQALVRLWREIMGSFAALQGEVSIVVPSVLEGTARRHFGGAYAYRVVPNDEIALNTILAEGATAAVLSWPSVISDWWLPLTEQASRSNIVAAVPFLTRRVDHEALIVGHIDVEKTGDDRTLLVVPNGERLAIPHRLIATAHGKCLVELNGFLTEEDVSRISGALRLGAYATPYQSQDMMK